MDTDNSFPIFTLLPPFYDPPPYKDVTVYLKQIEKAFSIKIQKYYYDRYAFGNDVFIINDLYVFRFPRTAQTRQHLKYEIKFLHFLQNKTTMKIPHYSFVAKNRDFAGYTIIPGKLLSPATFQSLSRKNKEKVVTELILFVNSFHSINIDEFAKYKPRKRADFIPIEKRIEEELETKLFPRLSKKDSATITNFYKESKPYFQQVPNNCPTHGDLYAYNVIWDKQTSTVGIIDFSDYLVTDPARDFELFYDFGPFYAQMAYEKYEGPKDTAFLQRAQIYWKLHGIYTLLSSLFGAPISYEYAYKYFFQKKFNLC